MNPIRNFLRASVFLISVLVAVNVVAQEKSTALSVDEASALGATRTVNTAETVYVATYKKGYSRDLLVLGEMPGSAVPAADHAALVAKELAEGKWGNYLFTYKPGPKGKDGNIASYTLTIRPLRRRGRLVSYFTDQTGVVRWTKENRAPTAKDPPIDSLPGAQ